MKVIVRQVPVKVLDGVFFVFFHNQEYYGIVNLSPESLNGLTRKRKPLHYSVRIEGLHRLRKDTVTTNYYKRIKPYRKKSNEMG